MGSYRGNADKVMEDAERIVGRLKNTDVTLGQLKTEYHCAYPTLYKAIFSRIPKEEYRKLAYARTIRGNAATRFKKGHKTWNKNMKGLHLSPSTEFKNGHLPANHKTKGSVIIRTDTRTGNKYRFIKVKGLKDGQHKWIPYAHYIWQQEKGEIPAGGIIAHENGDTLDDRIENLILTNRAGNIALMKRNNPNHRKKAIRNYKRTRRRKRIERERRKQYNLKIKRKEKKSQALEAQQKQIAEELKAKLVGEIYIWYECKGCGYETNHPDPPCTKCGSIAFEKIEQPLKHARLVADLEYLSKTGT